MRNEERYQATVWFNKKDKARIRKAVAWLNGSAPDHVRQALTATGPKQHEAVTNHSLGYHGMMQIVESCEDMMK